MPSYKPPTLPSATRRKALAGLAAAHASAGRAPSLILPRLYLANWTVAADEALLGELGYTPDEARALIEAGVVAGQHGADDAAPGGAPSPNELASA